jgi:type II secretory pathway component PulC
MNSKRIFLLGNLLVLALALWVTASMALTWISERRSAGSLKETLSGPPGSRAAVPRQGKTLSDYALISEKDVFQAEKADAKGLVREEAEIQVTERNLQLKGTAVGEGPKSYAVIYDHDSNKENVYFLDDYVMGARIARILSNKVILDSNGKEEALIMADERRALSGVDPSFQPGSVPRATPPARSVITPRRSVRAVGR